MDNWQKIFNSLREIKPDPTWSNRSRTEILLAEPRARSLFNFNIFKILTQSTELAAAMVLAVCLLFLLVGGSSIGNLFGPFRLASLDPASLKAEAQAIDIQIQLADLSYNPDQIGIQPTIVVPNEVIPKKSSPAKNKNTPQQPAINKTQIEPENTSNQTSTPPSIDTALDLLSSGSNI